VEAVLLGLVACLAGAINSLAGGGTLLTFPALLWAGRDPIVANATNTITLWPGSLAAAVALRRDLHGARTWLTLLFVPCVGGAILGAWLLLRTPSQVFGSMVPYLILFATGLFAVQGALTRRLAALRRRRNGGAREPEVAMPPIGGTATIGVLLFQLAVAVYGGYFGAGIGILTLAALGLVGFRDIHQMVGIRNVNAVWINGVAGLCFMYAGIIRWPDAAVLTCGQIVGGYFGARLTRRLPPHVVRRAVVAIGLGLAATFFLRLG